MKNFRPKPLFPKRRKLPGGLRLKPRSARPSRPIKGAPMLPFTTRIEDETRMYFAEAALQEMRSQLEEKSK